MRRTVLCLALLAAAALWVPGGSGFHPPIALDTAGGEAWTFDKLVEGSIAPGSCDTVTVATAADSASVRPEDGRFMARVRLAPGDNLVEARCMVGGTVVQTTQPQYWRLRLPARPTPHAQVAIAGKLLTLDGRRSALAPGQPAALVRFDWQLRDGANAIVGRTSGREATLPLPGADGEYRIQLEVADTRGQSDRSQVLLLIRGGAAEIVTGGWPRWLDDAIVMGVAPQYFGPGGLAEITARLDALSTLGVNTLWLPPLATPAAKDFGYAVIDSFQVRPDAGGPEALRTLIAAAHARRMRVIVDVVPNHLSDRHPYYSDAAARGRGSAYRDFFARGADGKAQHYFDWTNLKNLDFDNPDVQSMVSEAAAFWVRDFDVDGIRFDAAWGPRQRAPEFWPGLIRALKRLKPDVLLLAEASAGDPYYRTAGFDAAYDWTDKLGEWAWSDAFAAEERIGAQLRQAIERSPAPDVFRFLNNNDTGPRFITRHGAEATRAAAALLLTLPGIPALYAGDDTGVAFEPYALTAPLPEAGDESLQAWYARLIHLRRRDPALRGGELQFVDTGGTSTNVLAYRRGADRIVVLNFGAEPLEIGLPVTAGGGPTYDLLHDEVVPPGPLRLAPYGVRILARR